MIKNDLQYRLTKKQIMLFAEALEAAHANEDISVLARTIWTDALRSQLEELQASVTEYEGTHEN
jgi:hypothetical protein